MSGVCSVSFQDLVDYVEEQLVPDRRSELDAHMEQGCRSCRRELDWLRSVTSCMRSDDSREPPVWLTRRAVRSFRQHGPRSRPTLLRRIAATLVFDTSPLPNGFQPQLAGVRGGTLSLSRQMLFSGDEIDIDIRVEPGDGQDQVTLLGQVLPTSDLGRDLAGVEICMLQGRRQLFSKLTDQLGEFTIGRLSHGKYRLLIRLPDREIAIPSVEI